MIGSMVLLSSLIIAYNLYLYQVMDRQIELTMKNSLEMYTQETERDLGNTEVFLLTNCLKRDIIRQIQNPNKDLERYLAMLEVQEIFETSIASYDLMEGLFLYDAENKIYIGKTKLADQQKEQELIEENMDQLIEKFNKNAQNYQNEWFSKQLGEQFFLVKMFEIQSVYVGCWIPVNTILKELKTLPIHSDDYVLMLDAEHGVLQQDFPVSTIDPEKDSIKMESKRYEIIASDYQSPSFSFTVLRRKDNFFAVLNSGGTQILLALALSFSLSMVMWWLQMKFFFWPLNKVINAMDQLKKGNLEISLHEKHVFDEFQVLNDTFDSMTREIKKLKIEVYEEILDKQRTELLYLQEQINPHFLTNCMNLIRNLSIMGENERVQNAAVLVSNHMRYALANSTLVPLEKEIRHVKNYEELQKMRYGDQFILRISQQEGLEQCQVPTMLIQVFVDNAIKHQLDPDRPLRIDLEIYRQEEKLCISVADSGDGFSEEVLGQLQKHEKLINDEGEHVGIYNVCQRLELLYGEQAQISFSNQESGGAKIAIQIPAPR